MDFSILFLSLLMPLAYGGSLLLGLMVNPEG